MKELKRRIELFSFYDKTGIEAHLERMARKGWQLESMSNLYWTYRRAEPQSIRYAVSYYATISDFEPEPTEEQQSFMDFCEHSGWKLAASTIQMQIFYNVNADPVPIETDPVLEVQNIHRSVKKTILATHIMLMIIGLLLGTTFVGTLLTDPVGLLASTIDMFTGIWCVMVFLYSASELGGYLMWRRRARTLAERGEFLPTRSHRWLLIAILVFMLASLFAYILSLTDSYLQVYMTAYLIIFLSGFFLVRAVKNLLKRRGVKAATNKALTFAASFALAFLAIGVINVFLIYAIRNNVFGEQREGLPFTVSDLTDVNDSGYLKTNSREDSLLLGQIESSQHPLDESERPSIGYTLTEVKLSALYDWCVKSLCRIPDSEQGFESFYEYRQSDAAPWGADTAYQMHKDGSPIEKYLICFDDVILELVVDWEITPEQMRMVGEKITMWYQ